MPDLASPAISEENLQETRRLAEDVNNLNHAIPGRRNTMDMPDEVVEALNAAGDRYGKTDWVATDDEQIRVMVAWCELLPNLGLVPGEHDPNTAEWHWSAVRCILAGAGYEAHAALATNLCLVYPQCTLMPAESLDEWTKALREAHQQSGIPACLAALPWSAIRNLPEVSNEVMHAMDTRWVQAVALLHILKHTRMDREFVRVLYHGSGIYLTRESGSNALDTQPRFLQGWLAALAMERMDGREATHPLAEIGTSSAIKRLCFANFLPAKPLSAVPGSFIVGPFTRLAPDPASTGWFQHGLRLTRAWVANDGRTRTFSGNDGTIMGYAWALEAPTDDQAEAHAVLAASVPATYEVDSPFAILCQYQPNIEMDWVVDADAYASLIDAVLVMAVMRDRVPGAKREFPLLWVLPDHPTTAKSTNQGKTSTVCALAGAMTPGIEVSRPTDSNSAPDLRVVGSMLRTYGTVALDEWYMPKNQSHPLSARNLQTLATGGVIPLGEVMANNPVPLRLRQPIVSSAKCLNIPEDIRNRSLFIFQRTMTPEERQEIRKYEAMVGGEVALRLRLASLSLVDRFKLWEGGAQASESLRFTNHAGLASRLYALRTGTTGPEALAAITVMAQRMEARFNHHFTDADESGLMSEMESGESLSVRATTIFGTMTSGEVLKMRDVTKEMDRGRCTPGQLLQARAKVDDNTHTVRGLLTNLMGVMPKANERALAQAFGRDLCRLMPEVGKRWAMPEVLGIEGWAMQRTADSGTTPRFRLITTNPASPHFIPFTDA